MRFIKIVLSVVIGLVVVIAVAGYLFVRNFDLNKYKSDISLLAQERLGRKLAINGDARLGISFSPTLIVNDVELANADWASQPQMVKVGSLEIKLALLPLLKRQVVIDNITLQNPVINLEINDDGTPNWNMFESSTTVSPQQVQLIKDQAVASGLVDMKTADKAAEMVQKNPASLALAGFAAQNILIKNGQFSLANHQTGSYLQVDLLKFALKAPNIDADINTEFDVLINGQNVQGTAVLGSLNKILAGTEDYPINVSLSAYGVSADASLMVHNILTEPSFAMTLNLHNPLGNFDAPEVKLAADVNGNLQVLSANISSLNVNGNVITGTMGLNLSDKIPYVTANLNSDALDVSSLLVNKKVAFAFPEFISAANASQFVPNQKIPFELMSLANAKLALNVKTLKVNSDLTLNDVYVDASLLNNILNINPAKANLGGGTFNLVATVDAPSQNVKLTAVGNSIVLQQLYSKLSVIPNSDTFGFVSGGNTDINVSLTGKGDTYRQLVDSLNGSVIAIVDQSVVQSGKLDFLVGNFVMQILHTLKLDNVKSENIELNCAVVRADVANGIVNFPKGIALSSKPLNLVSSGKYNLVTDALDFTVRPYSGQIIDANLAQAISSFIKIKGTAQEPKIVLDDVQALKTLAGIAASGGTTYLGSQLVLDADSTPCYTALKGTPYQSRFPGPGIVSKTSQDIYQGADKTVNEGIDAVKATVNTSSEDVKKSLKNLEKAAKGFLNSLKQGAVNEY